MLNIFFDQSVAFCCLFKFLLFFLKYAEKRRIFKDLLSDECQAFLIWNIC